MTMETIATKSGVTILVETSDREDEIEVSLRLEGKSNCLLHWGVRRHTSKAWLLPPESFWPEGTRNFNQMALQTPFLRQNGAIRLTIRLRRGPDYSSIDFALFFPDEGQWDNNNGLNYRIALSQRGPAGVAPVQALRERSEGKRISFECAYAVDRDRQLAVAVTREADIYRIEVVTDLTGPLILHWGIARRSPHEWLVPPAPLRPPDTSVWNNIAAETTFDSQDELSRLALEFQADDAPLGIPFVLRDAGSNRWIKDHGSNFYIPVGEQAQTGTVVDLRELSSLAEEIVRAEMSRSSWTLMHRFSLCHDLLDRVGNNPEGLALLFVWMRFSAIRQLDWQRNYNTKPRELSHAQDRLTGKLAGIYAHDAASRPLIRLMLTTVGRGGEGQEIRDEILNIMHRHHIKEVSGRFMEEWHQKLHNNTTPDDIVICEAYLAFLRGNGNLDGFYKSLRAGGVTRQRLESFERPIRTDPDFVPHLKEGLIHDFEHFLKTLRSLHSGTDLETAINAANHLLDDGIRGLLSSLWQQRNDLQIPWVQLIGRITEARRRLNQVLTRDHGVRELLYLDLALEQFLRMVVERNIHLQWSGDELVDVIARVLENLSLSGNDPELTRCLRHWERLGNIPRFSPEWALHAKAVLERLGRALSAEIDEYYQWLQPKAEFLGSAFHADPWTITLFSEEVVRGGPAFVLSMLLHHMDPILRKTARLGNWQVISRGSGGGRVEVVDALADVQGKEFDGPAVVIADKVRGDEEIPASVTAVIASDATDIVSHVAVRARNANLLFATCYDSQIFGQLKSLRGRTLHLDVSAGGDVTFEEVELEETSNAPRSLPPSHPAPRPAFHAYALAERDFKQGIVGQKSYNLRLLHESLPEGVSVPSSVALPFGVFERVMELDINRDVARRYEELVGELEGDPRKALSELRALVPALAAPEELAPSLREAMKGAGLAWPQNWEGAWTCIKRVWASKWNDRAYLSRNARGIAHEDLFMAVLIQQVIEAEYAFVIHTVNPFSGNRGEVYAEVVLGLGESLVANYPGRALSFSCNKKTHQLNLVAYPRKSEGLYGGGLIFRSDSSGEDLAGYAGAGLYDSVLLEPPRRLALDYTVEPIVWDERLRNELLKEIARIGLALERVFGSPQDIEGAYAGGLFYVVQTRPQVGVDGG